MTVKSPKCLTAFLTTCTSGISSVAHHNPYINVFVVYLLTQELFVDKIHFFKFLYMSGKPWLGQLKVITADTRGTSFSKSFRWCKEGEYQQERGNTRWTNAKPQQLINHTKIPYSVALLLFCKFSCVTSWNGLQPRYLNAEALQVPQKVRILLVWYLLSVICILVYSSTGCGTLKIYLCLEDNRSSFFRVSLKSEIKDVRT